ncbi:MAG: lamin tail domain-containing protein [Verrucomicrobia bacterium]|nr:lamin tail domain-containing protein [Verrucomicrobiota bacterium]
MRVLGGSLLLFTSLVLACGAAKLPPVERVVINEIHFDPPEKKALEFIELYNPNARDVSLAGWTLEKFTFAVTSSIPACGFVVVAREPAAFAKAFGFQPLGPLPGKLKNHGERIVLRDANSRIVDEVRYGAGFPWPTASAGAGASLERIHPDLPGIFASSWRGSGFRVTGGGKVATPTPGKTNSVFTLAPPPAVESIAHLPQQPREGEAVTVTVKFAELRAVTNVVLQVQVVEPGRYIRKSDPEFAKSWREFAMRGDGHGMFTATVPGEFQVHRRLLRYRVRVEQPEFATTLPYEGDASPNFAWFCYNGVPAWTGASQPGKTPPLTFSSEFLGTLPTYHLIANRSDVERSQWDGGANKQRFTGTFVYEGRVYDHIQFHNRGQASTYVAGKNKWGFHFNRAREFEPRDLWGRVYPHTWNNFDMNACASPWVQVNRGMAGMDEAVSFRAYQLAGVPSASTHWVHWRVITGADEASPKSQYDGDLWGLYLAVQVPDGAWLKDRGLPDGNTYSHESGRKHLASGMPADNSDWNKFMDRSRQANPEPWWRANLDLPAYSSFHAMNRVVSNVDLRHGGNHYFYHNPDGHWVPVPWDLDMMFIPKTHWPGIIDQTRCLDVPAIKLEYKNRAREVLDLFCSDAAPDGGQIGQLVAELSRVIQPPGQARNWAELDMAMWNYHPRTSQKGAFYQTPYEQGMMGGNFRRTLAPPDFAGFCKLITEFCTDSRPQKNYAPNDGDIRGYGFGHLWWESRDDAIPARPTVRMIGEDKKSGARVFEVSAFESSVKTNVFAAVQWRAGRISAPGQPGFREGRPWRYEIEPYWQSEEITTPERELRLDKKVLASEGVYRIRARYRDHTGRWSHWSEPVQLAVAKR